MAGSSIPGPLGIGQNTPKIDAGTLARIKTPPPGSVGGADLPAPTQQAADVQVADAQIDALDLSSVARTAAYALKKAHPSVKFTSGRRSKEQQAGAMAGNVVKNRKWIEETYANSTLRTKCQEWVDKNDDKKTESEVADGLVSVFNTVDDTALAKFSKHLSGDAFDVQPVVTDAEVIKKTIRGLTGLDKFLETEGGLERWHAQF